MIFGLLSLGNLTQDVLHADFTSRANTTMWLDLDHMIRGEHTWEEWG
jgi:hypothetical protein